MGKPRKERDAFIRSCPTTMSPREVVAIGKRTYGLSFDVARVRTVRAEAASTKGKGFKNMADRALQAELSARGGRAAHKRGVAHEFDHREAVEAGRKGGRISAQHRRERAQGKLPPPPAPYAPVARTMEEVVGRAISRAMIGGS